MFRITLFRSLITLFIGVILVAPTFAQRQGLPSTTAPQAEGDEFWDDRFPTPGLNSRVWDAAVAADGTLYASVDQRIIMRWDGRSWQKIGETGSVDIEAFTTIGNTLYVAGDFTNIDALPVKYLARWNGSSWEQVGNGTGPQQVREGGVDEGSFLTLATVDGKLVVGGEFNRIDGIDANSIAIWDGNAWSPLGLGVRSLDFDDEPNEVGKVHVIVSAASMLYVGGEFQVAGASNSNSIARWDGAEWSALGTGIVQTRDSFTEMGKVYAIAVSQDTVYAGGEFNTADNATANNVAAWNGTAWSVMGNGITAQCCARVDTLLIDGDGVLAGGDFEFAGGAALPDFARWTGETWEAAAQIESSFVDVLVPTANGYYIGGNIKKLDGVLVENIGLYTETGWKALGQGLTAGDNQCCAGTVYAVANDGAGHIYVGGKFKTAGGLQVNNIAMWDGIRWHALGTGVADGDVRALLLLDDELYVGGSFKSAGGAAIQYLAKWNIASGQWSGLGSGVNSDVYALEYMDGQLYVGGDMSAAGGVKVSNIAAWDGANWSALSEKLVIRQIFDNCSEAGSQVYAIKASGRYLAIGGAFSQVQIGFAQPCAKESYFPANNILLWDRIADEWFFLGGQGMYGVTGGDTFRNEVKALEVAGGALQAGGDLYVGGEFGQAGLEPAANLARFSLTDGWESIGGVSGGSTGFLTYPGVAAIEAVGSDLYIGGNFSLAGTGPAKYVSQYSLTDGSWTALGSGLDDEVFALTPALNGLYVGGEFTKAGGKATAGFGHWGVPIPGANETPTPVVIPPTETATTNPSRPTATATTNPSGPTATATTNPSGPTATSNPSGPTATSNPSGPTATSNPSGPTAIPPANGQQFRIYLPFVRR